jgi:hypothetical protein
VNNRCPIFNIYSIKIKGEIMKEFRKTKDGLFICEECQRTLKNKTQLSQHIRLKHDNVKIYFDKWLKTVNEEFCKNCGKASKFYNLQGYKIFCCKKCADKLKYEKTKLSNFKKYGVDNPFQLEVCKEKMKKTKKERYGDENYHNIEKIKQTCLNKYGVDNISKLQEIKDRKIKTCLKNHNVKHPFQNKQILEKSKQTCLEKYDVEFNSQRKDVEKKIQEKIVQTNLKLYGVERPIQNKEIFEKACKTLYKLKRFKNTNIWYQGSYELDFLEKYYDKFTNNITRAPSIKYEIDGKYHYYHPDFYISSLNLIIECKSDYTYNKIIDPIKERAVINEGFIYIMIKNKDYSKINFLL